MHRRRAPCCLAAVVTAVALVALTAPVLAAPQPGYRESFPGTDIAGWQGGTFPTNPGAGGVSGALDGFLLIERTGFAGNLGAFGSTPPYSGNWTAAGITQVFLWLNDVGGDEELEIHVSLGDADNIPQNYWQYNIGLVPPEGRWAQFAVDLTNASDWTQIIGPANTFAAALANVTKLHVRHDKAPFMQSPDEILGDVGLDEIFLFAAGAAGVPPRVAVSRPLELAPPTPNPARGPVALRMTTYEDGPVRLAIVDVLGRTVRSAELPSAAAGVRTWLWDGADDSGRRVAPGVYRVRAVGPSGGTSRPLVRVR